MESTVSCSENKVQKCILESWKIISLELKKYCDIVKLSDKYISLLIAHETTLCNVLKADVKSTELYKMDPDIGLKLQFNIKREIFAEETALSDILKDLQTVYNNIKKQIDKIFSINEDSNLSFTEMIKESAHFLSTVEMLEAVDEFKRSFSDNHDGRKYSLECWNITKDTGKLSSAWDTSEIVSLKEELDLKLL